MRASNTRQPVQPIFFTASLEGNIPTLQISIPIINKYYKYPDFFIVCPKHSVDRFTVALKSYPNIHLIIEDDLISFAKFKQLTAQVELEINCNPASHERLGWYYQQALKLSFLVGYLAADKPAVMWDADSIPLTHIKFFDPSGNRSIVYGSRSEFNIPYFETLKNIFSTLPEHFYAATIQFFSCTARERAKLIDRLTSNYPLKSNESKSLWVANLIIHSVLRTHGTFSGSFFSEQELVGLSNILTSPAERQIPLKHLRWGISGRLSRSQMLLAKLFRFKHLTYENPEQTLSKKQAWGPLLALLIAETRQFNR